MKQHKLILIVEDNDNDALLLQRTFAKVGVPNPRHLVKDGEAAMSYLVGLGPYHDRQKYPLPGLVLLDLKMPGLDGFEVLGWIRHHQDLKDLRVVVLTASDEIRDVNQAYRLGANSFLVKPLEIQSAEALFCALQAQHVWEEEDDNNRQREPKRLPVSQR
jgi:CheY-like chemotaxis protein